MPAVKTNIDRVQQIESAVNILCTEIELLISGNGMANVQQYCGFVHDVKPTAIN